MAKLLIPGIAATCVAVVLMARRRKSEPEYQVGPAERTEVTSPSEGEELVVE